MMRASPLTYLETAQSAHNADTKTSRLALYTPVWIVLFSFCFSNKFEQKYGRFGSNKRKYLPRHKIRHWAGSVWV